MTPSSPSSLVSDDTHGGTGRDHPFEAAAAELLARELRDPPAVAADLPLPSPTATRRMAASLHAALWA